MKVISTTTGKNITTDTVSPLRGNAKTDTVSVFKKLLAVTKTDTVSVLPDPLPKIKTDTVSVLKCLPFQTKSDTVSVLKTQISSLRRSDGIPKKSARVTSSSRSPFVSPSRTDTPRGSFLTEVQHAA